MGSQFIALVDLRSVGRLLALILALCGASQAALAEPAQQSSTSRFSREPVQEVLEGAKAVQIVHENLLVFGKRTFTAKVADHPLVESSRSTKARSWRSPWCTLWRDGCERCRWAPEEGRIACFEMADGASCQRTSVVCEDVDHDLMVNRCAVWRDGCNDCSLHTQDGDLRSPCTALLCRPRTYYQEGFRCEATWRECEAGRKRPGGFDCPTDTSSIRLFRAVRQAQTRARLKAFTK